MRSKHLAGIIVIAVMALSLTFQANSKIPSDIPREGTFQPTAMIGDIACASDSLYLGGYFDYVGPKTGASALLDLETGQISKRLPYIGVEPYTSQGVRACAPDGSGGWYVGGEFYNVPGPIFHILNDGTIDQSWNPEIIGMVQSIVVTESTVYLGGGICAQEDFSRIGLLAVDINTGDVINSFPSPDDFVYAMSLSGSTLYVGGDFSSIGGEPRSRLAAIDINTGNVTEWNPRIEEGRESSCIYAIQVNGSNVYIGGDFFTVGDEPRSSLAAVDIETGLPTDWNPDADGEVWFLGVCGPYIYAAGDFSLMGRMCANMAQFELDTGNLTNWNPEPNGSVWQLAFSGDAVYVSGRFTTIGGADRSYLACLDSVSGLANDWNPSPNQPSYCIQISDSEVFVGGSFASICGESRVGLAEIDAETGRVTSWLPDCWSYSQYLDITDNSIFSNSSSKMIAKFDRITGEMNELDALADGLISTVELSTSSLFACGIFHNIGGKARENLAEIDLTTLEATDWDAQSNGRVRWIQLAGETLYAGGDFSIIGGSSRKGIAALDTVSGAATDWNPNPSGGTVDCLAESGDYVYVGGSFTSVGGRPYRYFAQLDRITGNATDWNPVLDGRVKSIAVSGSVIYATGSFDNVSGMPRNGIAAFDQNTGELIDWNPEDCNNAFRIGFLDGSVCFAHGDSYELYDFPAASIPVAPVVNNPLEKSLNVTIDTNDGNNSDTQYAIYCPTNSKWVQTGGTLGDSRAWATAEEWGATTVMGLSDATTYEFRVRARNSDMVQTVAGPSATATTPCVITYSAAENGTISGEQRQIIQYGGNTTEVIAVPNTGSHFTQWSDGLTTPARSDANQTANNTITASFAINQYTLNYTIGVNGSITGEKNQTVNHGANGTMVTAAPNMGYSFTGWSDGVQTAERTEVNVTRNLSVRANLQRDKGSLTVTINPAGARTAGARWRRIGQPLWLESGATESGLGTGRYQIEFCPIAGWAKPKNKTVTIIKDELTQATATYSQTAVYCWDDYK